MKKLFVTLLALVFVLPIIVKADTIFVNSFYNDKVGVGSEVVVNTMLEYENYPSKMEYTYDPTMLSITKENITIPGSSNTIEIANGKVTIVVYENDSIETYGRGFVTLRFTTLKEGTTEIEPFLGAGYSSLPGKLTINISDNTSTVEIDPTEKEENTEPKEISQEEKNNDNGNDLIMYISLGLNAVLLISNIIVLVKTRKNKVEE